MNLQVERKYRLPGKLKIKLNHLLCKNTIAKAYDYHFFVFMQVPRIRMNWVTYSDKDTNTRFQR